MYSGLHRQQALSLPIVRKEYVKIKDEQVNSMCKSGHRMNTLGL